jgi:hypothetical protein
MKRFMLWSAIMMLMATLVITEPPRDAAAQRYRSSYPYMECIMMDAAAGVADSLVDLTAWNCSEFQLIHFGGSSSHDVTFTFYWSVWDSIKSATLKIEGQAFTVTTVPIEYGPVMDSVRVLRQNIAASSGFITYHD